MRSRMHTFTRVRALAAAVVPLGLVLSALTPAVAHAASTTGPDYEMPFPCTDTWQGTSRSYHSPSARAIDWNKTNDLGAFTVSSAPGVVTRTADLGNTSYGRYVIVDHGNGRSTLFAHLLSIWVTQGQAIDQGSIIGRVGSTGGSTGAHLHFEQRLNGYDQPTYFHRSTFAMGSTQSSQNCPDVPVTGDWNGNGVTDTGLFRRSALSRFRTFTPGARAITTLVGRNIDEPVTGDWNGDGRTDLGVRVPGTKTFLLRNGNGTVTSIRLGRVRDVGVTGDWDGNGRADVGVWNPGNGRWTLLYPGGRTYSVSLGRLGDRPVTGDWNGDGDTDLGVYTPSTGTFTLRNVTPAGVVSYTTVRLGTSTDLPLTGDWNGDGRGDVGVWSPTTAVATLQTTPSAGRGAVKTYQRIGRMRR